MVCKLQKDCPPFLRANLQLQLPDNLHSQFLTQGEHCFVRPYWPTISLKCCASFSWKLSFVAKRTLECPSFSCQRQSSPVFWPINLKWSFKNKILRGSRLKIGGCPRSFFRPRSFFLRSPYFFVLCPWCPTFQRNRYRLSSEIALNCNSSGTFMPSIRNCIPIIPI